MYAYREGQKNVSALQPSPGLEPGILPLPGEVLVGGVFLRTLNVRRSIHFASSAAPDRNCDEYEQKE